ncbi:MAG TPA: DNA-3-methyladenine glycosylase [Acidimicrobiales bacterium]|nr:DNA-3-methyladenine glycosylase [Acidimicrobiales bacterium]
MEREHFDRSFFEQDVDVVARELIGSRMTVRSECTVFEARLLETEAYGGLDDPASHAFRGPTSRSAIMFGPAGHLYVYRSYGIHWCMNVVTQVAGSASAVLLRAAEIHEVNDDDVVPGDPSLICRGPGNLTRALGITGNDNGADCCVSGGRIEFLRSPIDLKRPHVEQSTRVGISREKERRSRYFLDED